MLTVTIRMEENAFNVDVQLRQVVAKHEVFTNANFPRCRVVRQEVRPHRPVTSIAIPVYLYCSAKCGEETDEENVQGRLSETVKRKNVT